MLPMASQLIFLSLLLSSAIIHIAGDGQDFGRTLDSNLFGLKEEKLSHFRMYWHDIVSGPNPTAVNIVRPPKNTSQTGFGNVIMIDDPLTEGPDRNSKLLGRAQGYYGLASQEDAALLMAMNFVFIQGKYNESTITIMGRNSVFSKVREMPVIGGSGLFRLARGYVHASTYSFDQKSGDAVVEYNIYVLHY